MQKKSELSGETFMNIKSRNIFFQKRDSLENIVVLDKKAMKLRTLPQVDFNCIKCKEKIAETWTLDLGSEDNSQATFFRCISCGHTLRETE